MTDFTNDESEFTCLLMIQKRVHQAFLNCEELYKLNATTPDEKIFFERSTRIEDLQILFVTRLAQVNQWCAELLKLVKGKSHEEFRRDVLALKKALEPVISIRDFHAHEEEYLLGGGRKRKEFERESALPFLIGGPAGLSTISLVNSSVHVGDQTYTFENSYFIAGRVEPKVIMASISGPFGKLMQRFEAAQKERSPEKSTEK